MNISSVPKFMCMRLKNWDRVEVHRTFPQFYSVLIHKNLIFQFCRHCIHILTILHKKHIISTTFISWIKFKKYTIIPQLSLLIFSVNKISTDWQLAIILLLFTPEGTVGSATLYLTRQHYRKTVLEGEDNNIFST